MNLSSHVAIEHNEEDEILNVILGSAPNLEKDSTNSSFVFNEAMLDEFLKVEGKRRTLENWEKSKENRQEGKTSEE